MKNISFPKALSKLEEIVQKLETQDVDLEEGLKLLTEGLALHKMCTEKLKGAQSKIDKLLEEKQTIE